jgi:excisionase family DNA binding protein
MSAKPIATPPIRPLLATVSEVASYLSLSRGKVYQMMDVGDLPYVKLGRCRRIAWSDVEALVANSRVSPA